MDLSSVDTWKIEVASVFWDSGAKNYRAKNGASKRGGRGRGRKETLADKPLDFENRPLGLSCLSAHTEISCCHRLL